MHHFDYDSNDGPNRHAETSSRYIMGGSSLEITIDGFFPSITFTPILSNPGNLYTAMLLGFVMNWGGDTHLVGLNSSAEDTKVALKKFLTEEIRARARE